MLLTENYGEHLGFRNHEYEELGVKISKDEKAYAYLPESIAAFPEGEEMKEILRKLGYKNVQSELVSGGIATIYSGTK